MQVKVDATGEVFDVPEDQIGVLASKGGFSFPAGTQVPVRHSDGSIVAVPLEQFWAQPGVLRAATPEDLAAHAAEQQRVAAEQQDAALQEQYGSGLATTGRAHLEAAARGATLGISDWLLTQAGADPTGLKERSERNPLAAVSEFAGAIVPAVLTGGESAVAEGAVALTAKGAARAAAAATPAALAERIGAKVGAKVAANLGEGFSARMAAGAARTAAEGALAGVGGEISSRSLNGEDLLDPATMDEYLMAAGQGALIGGAFGAGAEVLGTGLNAAIRGGKNAASKIGAYGKELLERGGREDAAMLAQAATEGDALIATAKAADYDAGVRAAEQRLNSISDEELRGAQGLREQARAKLEAAAPEGRVLAGAAGERADAPLRAVGQRVRREAEALGVSPEVAESSWSRIESGKREFDQLDTTHADTTKKITAMGDELEKLRSDVLDEMDMARRNEALRDALHSDRTATAPDQFFGAMQAQHAKLRASLAEFAQDPDTQIQSWTKRLDKFLAKHETEMAALAKSGGDVRADAFEILDQSNRILGRVRDSLGDRTRMGIGTLSDTLANLYEETRQVLKNPTIVGEKVADISGRAKGRWSDVFDVNRGYRQGTLRSDAGGARTVAGFDTVDRFDPAKISSLLKSVDAPEGQLNLELFGRGLDSNAKLLEHFADDLKPGATAARKIERYRELSRQMADEMVSYRSKVALAKEYAAAAAPALKELEGLEGKVTQEQERLAARRAAAQEKLDAARERATEQRKAGLDRAADQKDRAIQRAQDRIDSLHDRRAESIAGTAVEALGPMIGLAVGGPAGAAFGYAAGKLLAGMSAPVIRSVAKSTLAGMLKAQERATRFETVHRIGTRVAKAGAAIVDRLHTAGPIRAAARVVAMEAPKDTQEEYDRTMSWVQKNAQTDQRAAYLYSIAPSQVQRTQLRPDLDPTPTVHPLAMRKFLRAARAANDPASVLESLAKGTQSKEGAEVLRVLYPRLHKQALAHIVEGAAGMTKAPSMRGQQELSMFFGTPIHFTMEPRYLAFTQSTYSQAQQSGQANQDMLEQPQQRARQINSKAARMQATGIQRLEGDV